MRHLLLILPLALLACENGETTQAPPAKKDDEAKVVEKPLTRAVTGVAVLQRDHATYIEMIEKEEKKEKADPRTVKQVLKLLGILEQALERSAREQAVQDLKKQHSRGTEELGRIAKQRNFLQREKAEILQILANAAKGVAPIPSGFTEAELRDKLADFDEKLRKLKEGEDELLKEMQAQEKTLNSSEEVKPDPESMASRELVAVRETKKRAEALLAK